MNKRKTIDTAKYPKTGASIFSIHAEHILDFS